MTKECSEYKGLAGDFCTITSSNLEEIEVGSKVVYADAAGDGSLRVVKSPTTPKKSCNESSIHNSAILLPGLLLWRELWDQDTEWREPMRALLSVPVPARRRRRLSAWLRAPSMPGRYRLTVTLVQENVGWLNTDRPGGQATIDVDVITSAPTQPLDPAPLTGDGREHGADDAAGDSAGPLDTGP